MECNIFLEDKVAMEQGTNIWDIGQYCGWNPIKKGKISCKQFIAIPGRIPVASSSQMTSENTGDSIDTTYGKNMWWFCSYPTKPKIIFSGLGLTRLASKCHITDLQNLMLNYIWVSCEQEKSIRYNPVLVVGSWTLVQTTGTTLK